MTSKPKILFVGDYCRTDYLQLLNDSRSYCDFWFLYFDSPKEEQNKSYLKYGQAIYWSNYKDVQSLLKALAPQKVLFLDIDTFKPLILNLACKSSRIYTYHLEHGMRADYAINHEGTKFLHLGTKLLNKFLRIFSVLSNLKVRVKARLFLKNSISQLSDEDAQFAKAFISLRSRYGYLKTFNKLISDKRNADCYISFSPKVFQVHQKFDHLPVWQPVHFIGVPYFDKLVTVTSKRQERAILFIDQPLAEHKLHQWTRDYKKEFIIRLSAIVQRYQYKLYIKPHPRQDTSLWSLSSNMEIIDDDHLKLVCGNVPIIIGFYSTYLMPFAALTHTTLLTLENHPAGSLDVSKSFTDAGVAHPIYNLNQDLPWALEHMEELHQKQLPNKAKFTEDWLYKFDGKAGERLCDILLSDEL